ncbi:MAG: hypothetical protein IJ565_01845 [Bacilli bacterium]|nr:hypothetical protein [Bacilli bacterium]
MNYSNMKKEELIIKYEMPYKDITKVKLENAIPKSHNVRFDNYFIDDNKIKHPIKGKEKASLTDKKSDEYKMAKKIRKIFGGKIHIVPRIETEKGYKGLVSVKTPDYIWNNEKWDLKTPGTDGEFLNTFERFLKKKGAKKQAKKYIINYINFPNKTNKEIINVIQSTLIERDWVEEVIVMKGEEVIKIYSKA